MNATLIISSSDIRVLTAKGKRVRKWGCVSVAPGLVKDGLILQPKELGRAIDELFRATKIPRKRVVTCLSGLSFTYRVLSFPPMQAGLANEAILRAARKEMTLPVEEHYISWQRLGRRGNELDYFVVAVPRNLIDALAQSLMEARIRPHFLELKPLALARAASRRDALIVDMEPDCFDVVVVANGAVALTHTLTPRGGRSSLEDNTRRLATELSTTVAFYNSSHSQNPLSPEIPLLLTGKLSSDSVTSELLKAELGYPVEPLVSPLKSPPDLSPALYTSSMGLALKGAPQLLTGQYHDIDLNILPATYRRARRPAARYALVSLALAIAIGLLLPMYQLKTEANAETMRLRSDLSQTSEQLHQARLSMTRAKQTEATISQIAADIAKLKQAHQQVLENRGAFASSLELVTSAIPSQAYFTLIDVGSDQVTIKGKADNPYTVVNYATALESRGRFREVRIAEIGETEAGKVGTAKTGDTWVSFTIVVSKRSST